MPSFPTSFSEAKGIVNSWNPLALWPSDQPRQAKSSGEGTTHSNESSPVELPQTSSARSTDDISPDKNARDPSADASHRNVRIFVGSSGAPVQRGGGLEEQEHSRYALRSPDPRRLSIASGVTERSTDGASRRRALLETYVIVKPPSATAKHPLNLQIQLVVRRGNRPRAASQEGDISQIEATSDADAPGADLPQSAHSNDAGAIMMGRSLSDGSAVVEDTTTDDARSRPRRAGSIKSTISSDTSASSLLGGTRKRVEPMFNLTVHNVVQPTVVTDAATDAKVAKFLKRSVDILGLGTLEPAEVWTSQKEHPDQHTQAPSHGHGTTATSRIRHSSTLTPKTSPMPPELVRSTESLSVISPNERSSKRHSLDVSTIRAEKDVPEGTTKKLLGRIFRKRAGNAATNSPGLAVARDESGTSANLHARLSRHSSRNSHTSTTVPSLYLHPVPDDLAHGEGNTQQSNTIGHPTFGTSPSILSSSNTSIEVTSSGAIGGLTITSATDAEQLSSTTKAGASSRAADSHPFPLIPSTRPLGYSWTVSKWAKKRTETWLQQLSSSAASQHRQHQYAKVWEEATEGIVFEWVKVRLTSEGLPPEISKQLVLAGAKPTIVSTGRMAALQSAPNRQASLSTTSSTRHDDESGKTTPIHGRDTDSQTSHSISHGSIVDEPESGSDHTYDSGDETDPEDSETPWTCSLWVKRTGERIPLATLTPAPHHPKVIGILKIPLGLKGARLGLETTRNGGLGQGLGLVGLSEENLKDVVCVTAMWIVAREEFGGIGKKRRA